MKVSISLRDELFQAAERLATSLRLSRSEVYARALTEYVDRHAYERVTERLNEIYAESDSSADEVLKALQLRSLPREDW